VGCHHRAACAWRTYVVVDELESAALISDAEVR
jgi:hypothetical protein